MSNTLTHEDWRTMPARFGVVKDRKGNLFCHQTDSLGLLYPYRFSRALGHQWDVEHPHVSVEFWK